MKKNILLVLSALMIVAGAVACAAPAAAVVGSDGVVTRQINVTGVGQVAVTPDVAYINVGVRNQAETVADALQANNAQAQQIKDVLMAQGVEEKDIQTSSFNVYPQPEYDFNGQIVRNLFAVENTVYITVRNLDKMGDLLDAVAQSGANTIYGIYFDLTDKTEAQRQARDIAIAYAKDQAAEIAQSAGVKLGEILTISIYVSGAPVVAEGYGMGGGGYDMPAYSRVPVSAGQMVITSNVTIAFAIK